MNRRGLLISTLGALVAAPPVFAHTPYGQWVVYRKKHLLIGAHRVDGKTYEFAKDLAARLANHLPKANSRVARAPNAQRLASLIGTDQLDIAVLGNNDALDMLNGRGRFHAYGSIDLTSLAVLGDYLLVAHRRFPERHGWLVAAALHRSGIDYAVKAPSAVGFHPGALAFLNGDAEPKGG